MFNKSKNSRQFRFILVAVFYGCVMSWGWPVTSYAHTRMGTGEKASSNSTPLDVQTLNVDSSDPVHATITYQVKGTGTIQNVAFSAPGQSDAKAASKKGTFTFTFNQKSFPKPLMPLNNQLLLTYESNGKQKKVFLDIGDTLGSDKGVTGMTLEVPDPSSYIGYIPLPIISTLYEYYDRYDYENKATANSKVVLLGTPLQEMVMDAEYGITMSPVVNHWYSSKENESMLSHNLPLNSDDTDANGRFHFVLSYHVDSTFTLYDELKGHSEVDNQQTLVYKDGIRVFTPIDNVGINVDITP